MYLHTFLIMVNLVIFGVSVNNLVFSSVDIRLLHYAYLAKCCQYVVAFVFIMSSLQLFKVLYSKGKCNEFLTYYFYCIFVLYH